MSAWMRRSITALGVFGVAAAGGLCAEAAAYADSPTQPASINNVIERDGLNVEVSNGWEAVTGPARGVNDVRNLADSLGEGTLVVYTGDNETGQAVLIFTGGGDASPNRFDVTGGVIRSVDNDTDQPWYVYDDHGVPDAALEPDTASNIKPADAILLNGATAGYSPSFAQFTF